MNIEREIFSRIENEKIADPTICLSDFQLRAAANGYVLENLKTGQQQFISDCPGSERVTPKRAA